MPELIEVEDRSLQDFSIIIQKFKLPYRIRFSKRLIILISWKTILEFRNVPIYNPPTDIDIFDLLELPKKKPSYETTWGKEHADPLGVRKNYLEKVFYGNIKTDFDYNLFKEIVIL